MIVEEPLPAVIDSGVAAMVDCEAETPPGVTLTVTVCPTATVLIMAETVLLPATMEASVPVATPLAFVVPTGCVRVLPAVGVAERVTVAPSIGLPSASFAVTVMVDDPVPAAIGDVAATVDCDADTAAGFTVTVAVSVTTIVPFTVAVTVFGPAAVELNVPVICPLALVVPTGWVSVFPVGEAARVTVAPLTALPKPSFTVTVIVAALEPVLAVMVPGVADTRDWLASGPPAVPVAVKITGLPLSPFEVAVRVFMPVVVPRVHEVTVAMPLALVATAVVGTTAPPPETTANVTETPATGLPNWSRTTTDGSVATAVPTVADWPLPALTAMLPASPAVPVAVNRTVLPARPLAVAVSVSSRAAVASVQLPTVATPLALVV